LWINKYDLIAYENLAVSNMMKSYSLAKAIQDASWLGFWVELKTKQKGILTVDPEYSTLTTMFVMQRLIFLRGHLYVPLADMLHRGISRLV